MAISVLLTLLLLGCRYSVADHDDVRVTALPGWHGSLPSAHYSGYMDVDVGRMHYLFVESENECGHAKDEDIPLVLWVQGGPGCSSLLGYFTEMGTFTVEVLDGSPKLQLNAHRWSRCAHMLYWESPVGVGYSYSPRYDYQTNDSYVADMNLQFLVKWFAAFPEHQQREFYIAGESYAGVYIPMLTSRIYQHNFIFSSNEINLKGIMVGNGCIGNKIGACSDSYDIDVALPYLYNHGLVGDVDYTNVRKQCAGQSAPSSDACVTAINTAYKNVGPINVYNVLGTCDLPSGKRRAEPLRLLRRRRLLDSANITGLPNCADGPGAQMYMQREDVQKAMHIMPDSALAPWTPCSDTLHAYYGETIASVLDDYETVLGQYRILIYNGDADARIPFTDNKNWTETFAADKQLEVTSPWQPWLVDSQVGGYAVRYTRDFMFATVRGAGHMVPQFRPEAAYEMFTRFLAGTF